jgi:hypothetical protein
MNQRSNDDLFAGCTNLSCQFFKELKCLIADYIDDNSGECDLQMFDVDKMMCHILDCLVALRKIQRGKRILKMSKNEQHEKAINRLFASVISTIMSDEESVEGDHRILISLLASFPDKEKMTDGRSLLPLHFALALGDVVREEDVHILH